MPRKWKNSDDVTFYTDKNTNNRLEKLRVELIPNYGNRYNKNKNYRPKNSRPKFEKK